METTIFFSGYLGFLGVVVTAIVGLATFGARLGKSSDGRSLPAEVED